MQVGTYEGFPIFVSSRPDKKYMALVNNKKVFFGSRMHEHYYDLFGTYSFKNHLEKDRRKAYYARHGKSAKKGTAKYFSHNILWPLNI